MYELSLLFYWKKAQKKQSSPKNCFNLIHKLKWDNWDNCTQRGYFHTLKCCLCKIFNSINIIYYLSKKVNNILFD